MAAMDLFKVLGENGQVENPYSDDIEALWEQNEVIREDQFLEDIFGPESKLDNETFVKVVGEKVGWIFNAVELRRRLFESAGIEAKHFDA